MPSNAQAAAYVAQYALSRKLPYAAPLQELESGLAHPGEALRYHRPQPSPLPPPAPPRPRTDGHRPDKLAEPPELIRRVTGVDNPHDGRLHVALFHGPDHLGDLVLADDGTIEPHAAAGKGPAVAILRSHFNVTDEAGLRRLAEELDGGGDSGIWAVLVDGRDRARSEERRVGKEWRRRGGQ